MNESRKRVLTWSGVGAAAAALAFAPALLNRHPDRGVEVVAASSPAAPTSTARPTADRSAAGRSAGSSAGSVSGSVVVSVPAGEGAAESDSVATPMVVSVDADAAAVPSTVAGVIDVSRQSYVAELVAPQTLGALGLLYSVVPSAPHRTTAELLVLCDGQPTRTLTTGSSIAGEDQACFGAPGRHLITVSDRRNEYPNVSVPWQATQIAAGPLSAPAGDDLVIRDIGVRETPLSEGPRELTMERARCEGTVCTIPGSALGWSANPAANSRQFAYSYRSGALTVRGSVNVSIYQPVSPG